MTELKPGWQRVKFAEIAECINDRVDDPSAAGVERYVGLEHLDPESLTALFADLVWPRSALLVRPLAHWTGIPVVVTVQLPAYYFVESRWTRAGHHRERRSCYGFRLTTLHATLCEIDSLDLKLDATHHAATPSIGLNSRYQPG